MGDSARLCLFCLEKRTNRQKIFCIENLFSCECRVYCHKKCIKQWHRFCGDDLQCPLCRKSLDVHIEVVQVIVIDLVNYQRRELIKNICFLFMYLYFFLYAFIYYFTYHQPS